MNLRQCEVFRAVMEAASVTQAAERLHVTQPAVSKTLAQLERDLGFRVFLRQRRRHCIRRCAAPFSASTT